MDGNFLTIRKKLKLWTKKLAKQFRNNRTYQCGSWETNDKPQDQEKPINNIPQLLGPPLLLSGSENHLSAEKLEWKSSDPLR